MGFISWPTLWMHFWNESLDGKYSHFKIPCFNAFQAKGNKPRPKIYNNQLLKSVNSGQRHQQNKNKSAISNTISWWDLINQHCRDDQHDQHCLDDKRDQHCQIKKIGPDLKQLKRKQKRKKTGRCGNASWPMATLHPHSWCTLHNPPLSWRWRSILNSDTPLEMMMLF